MEIVTQFCFNHHRFCQWMAELASFGIDLPVVVGLCGPAKLRLLHKFADACGVPPPASALPFESRATDSEQNDPDVLHPGQR